MQHKIIKHINKMTIRKSLKVGHLKFISQAPKDTNCVDTVNVFKTLLYNRK